MRLQTPACDFGEPAPAFTLPAPDGTRYNSAELMGEGGLLVCFICNHCPYVIDVMPRLVGDMIKLRANGIGLVCIMSNDYEEYPADSPDRMVEFADVYGMTAPYLIDADQSVAKAYGAVCTPDFFGFSREQGLQYRGRLDDVAMRGDASARAPELLDAMIQVAQTGFGPENQTPSMGCSIKWL